MKLFIVAFYLLQAVTTHGFQPILATTKMATPPIAPAAAKKTSPAKKVVTPTPPSAIKKVMETPNKKTVTPKKPAPPLDKKGVGPTAPAKKGVLPTVPAKKTDKKM
jgi:hypothetical protein